MATYSSPRVSIVIPVYNGADYIESAIYSVLQQDYPNLELIVLNDGSTDNTQDILNQFGGKLYWETHPNMGQANTLNKGWSIAKGTVLSYLSADDQLSPEAVSTSVRYLENHPNVVMTYCDFKLIDPDSTTIGSVRPDDFDYQDMVVNFNCPPGPGVFFRRHAFESAGNWNGAYRQMPDFEFWLRLGLIGPFARIPEVLASFRIHKASQSFATGDSEKSEEPIKIINEYFGSHTNIPLSIQACRLEAVANAHLVSSQLHWRSMRIRKSAQLAIEAISIYPKVLTKKKTFKLIFNALFNRIGRRFMWWLKGSNQKL